MQFRTLRADEIECRVGTVIVIGVDGEDFCDVPITFKTWKKLLEEWGN